MSINRKVLAAEKEMFFMITEKLECEGLKNNNGIFLLHSGRTGEKKLLYHDFVAIAYIAHGEGVHIYNGTEKRITEGDILVINPNVSHCIYSLPNYDFIEMYYCYIEPNKIMRICPNISKDFPELIPFFDNSKIHILKTNDTPNREIRSLFVRIIDEFNHCPPGCRDMIDCYFGLIYTKILRQFKKTVSNPVLNQNKLVDKVIQYINYNFNFGISVKDIAEAMHIAVPYLCRVFKKYTGTTVLQFINNMKISKAKDYLADTDRSIESISVALNCSPVYLCRLFKKHTGMTLLQYREKNHYKIRMN